jgi:hypothetical protein
MFQNVTMCLHVFPCMCVAGVQVALADADLYTMKQIVQGVDDLDPDEFNNPSDSGTQTDTFNLKCSCQPFQCKNPFAFNTPRKTTSEFVSRLQRCFTVVQKAFVKVVLCLNTFFDCLPSLVTHTHTNLDSSANIGTKKRSLFDTFGSKKKQRALRSSAASQARYLFNILQHLSFIFFAFFTHQFPFFTKFYLIFQYSTKQKNCGT